MSPLCNFYQKALFTVGSFLHLRNTMTVFGFPSCSCYSARLPFSKGHNFPSRLLIHIQSSFSSINFNSLGEIWKYMHSKCELLDLNSISNFEKGDIVKKSTT